MPSRNVELDQPTVFVRDGKTVIHIPMRLKHNGGRKQIIVPHALDGSENERSPIQHPLALALARGFRWRDLLESGKFSSVASLAEAVKADPSYVRRQIRLTCLAPDLVRMILDGQEPDGVSLEQLARKMPGEWEEQRKLMEKPLNRDLS